MTQTGSSQSSSNARRLVYASISIASVVLTVVSVGLSNRTYNTSNYSPYAAPVPSPDVVPDPSPGVVPAPSPSIPCNLRRLARRRGPRPTRTRPQPSPRGCSDDYDDDFRDSADNDLTVFDDSLRPRRTPRPFDPPRRITRRPRPNPSPVHPPSFDLPRPWLPPPIPVFDPFPSSRLPFVAMSMPDWSSFGENSDPMFSMPMLDRDFGHGFIRRGEFINPSRSDGDGGVSTMSTRMANDTTSSHWDEYIDDVGFD